MGAFTEKDLAALAGSRSYARGLGYVDAVRRVRRSGSSVTAQVAGTEIYTVRLAWGAGSLRGDCDCPHGEDGNFCKHCVAVGLVVLSERPGEEAAAPEPDLRAYLAGLAHAVLVDLLLDQAGKDEALHRSLTWRATRAAGTGVSGLRRQLDAGLGGWRYVEYHDAPAYAQEAEEIVDDLARLLDEGHAAEVVPLARHAFDLVTKTLEHADDSDGLIGEVAYRLVEVHARACAEAPPDPVELARWMVDFMVDGFGVPELELDAYAPALGDKGLVAYRERVEELWARVPPRAERDPHYIGADDHRRYALSHLKEQLARAAGDVDELVEIHARDLSHPYAYLQIAQILTEAGRHAEALGWAERGLREHRDQHDSRLVDFLAERYLAEGRAEDALRLRRESFGLLLGETAYEALRAVAEPMGRWPAERERAQGLLREEAGRTRSTATTLTRILVAEEDMAGAWTVAAAGGCHERDWLTLAEWRGRTHPDDVIPGYEARVERGIAATNRQGYAEAADHLERLRELHARAGRPEDFAAYVSAIRERHRRKRNLMAELSRRGL